MEKMTEEEIKKLFNELFDLHIKLCLHFEFEKEKAALTIIEMTEIFFKLKRGIIWNGLENMSIP